MHFPQSTAAKIATAGEWGGMLACRTASRTQSDGCGCRDALVPRKKQTFYAIFFLGRRDSFASRVISIQFYEYWQKGVKGKGTPVAGHCLVGPIIGRGVRARHVTRALAFHWLLAAGESAFRKKTPFQVKLLILLFSDSFTTVVFTMRR